MDPNTETYSITNLMHLDVKCFQHCQINERFICFKLPDKCPTCQASIKTRLLPAKFKVPPFYLQAPLTNSKFKTLPSFSLLLQPTDGNYTKFIKTDNIRMYQNDYEIGDLHIGITNGNGDIFDFDQNGLTRNGAKWYKIPSIVVNLEKHLNTREQTRFAAPHIPNKANRRSYDYYKQFFLRTDKRTNTFADNWNNLLETFWIKRHIIWSSSRYDEFNFNCLNFIVSFLLEFGFFDINNDDAADFLCQTSLADLLKNEWIEHSHNPLLVALLKQKFSTEFIEPEFLKCLRFLNLLVKIKEKKCFKEII